MFIVLKRQYIDDDFTVEPQAYPEYTQARRRVDHLVKDAWFADWAKVEVWIEQPETKTEYVFPPHPVMPPSAVYTPETKEGPSWAYPAPRRVFQQPASLASAVSSAWNAWREAQITQGNLEAAAPEPPPVAQLFEESPSGQLSLFPRALP